MSEPWTDGEKLLVLAAWFDMWDRPETDRQAILDDDRNPGRNGVQLDLRRIAATLDARPALDVELVGRLAAVNHIAGEDSECTGDDGRLWCESCWAEAEQFVAPDAAFALAVDVRAALGRDT